MSPRLVLASASPFRKALLANAGLSFDVEPAMVDERAIEETLEGMDAEDTALILCRSQGPGCLKPQPGRPRHRTRTRPCRSMVISFHKPQDMEQARRRLLDLSGRTHELNSAVVLARDGETIWRHVSIARMTMR